MRVFSYRAENGTMVHLRTNDDFSGTAQVEVIRPEPQPSGNPEWVSEDLRVPCEALLRFAEDVERVRDE
jgi:hypothetical protein